MKQVRQGVFETNSSSTHSICICNEDDKIEDFIAGIDKRITIDFKQEDYTFGWERETYSDYKEKLVYLILCILCHDKDTTWKYLNKLFEQISSLGFSLELEGITLKNYDSSLDFSIEDSWVDHGCCADDLIEAVLQDNSLLERYLFSKKSFIQCGNDNDDIDETINVDYPHLEFYKGN